MRFFLAIVLVFSCISPAQAEQKTFLGQQQEYFFSSDSPAIVKNRIETNLERKSGKDQNILVRLIPSFVQDGDEFYIYGQSALPLEEYKNPKLLYTVKVVGSLYNRTVVHVIPAFGRDDLIMSNINDFMKGVVEKRESRVFQPQHDQNRKLEEALLQGAFWEISTVSNKTDKLTKQANDVFAEGKVADRFHESQVLQLIAEAQELEDYCRISEAGYESRGEDPVLQGVHLKDAFRKTIVGVERQIAAWQQYKRDYLDSSYQENRSRYEGLKTKLDQAYGYGYSTEKMFSGAYCMTSDGGSVLAGETAVNKHQQPLLLRFDKKGRLQFHKIFSADSERSALFRGITAGEDSNLLGILERIQDPDNRFYVVKLSRQGSLLWEKDFDNIVLNGVIYDPKGFYYVVGRTRGDNCSAFLAKLDLQGNVLTRKLFGSGHGRNSLVNGVVLADQSLVVVGYGTKEGDTGRRAIMLHISESDGVLSESFHGTKGSLFYAVAPSPDNTLLVAGTGQVKDVKKAVVFKLDPDGKEIWQTTIFDRLKDQNSEVYAIHPKGEEAILVGSAMEYGFVAKLNSKGELLWRDVYGESEKEDKLAGLCLRPDGKIMVAGQTNSYASMGGQNLWVFELADKKGKLFTAPPENPDATFLAENKDKAGVITLASGSQYKILREGTGGSPSYKDIVNIHYHGTFIDGQVFDSTYDRRESLEMEVEYFVKGLQELLQKMKVGCKWQLFIPADLAYGEQGRGEQIPPNKTLLYEMELLEIKGK